MSKKVIKDISDIDNQTIFDKSFSISNIKNKDGLAVDKDDNIVGGKVINYSVQIDSEERSFGDDWDDGMIWDNFKKRKGSAILLMTHIPMRNDDEDNWGGGYLDINYSTNNGDNWNSLGDLGYDAVMSHKVKSIAGENISIIIDLDKIVDSDQVKFKFRHKSYNGTLYVNKSHGITSGDYKIGYTSLSILELGA